MIKMYDWNAGNEEEENDSTYFIIHYFYGLDIQSDSVVSFYVGGVLFKIQMEHLG